MKRHAWIVRAAPAAAFLVLLLCFPKEMTQGVRQGLTLCGTAVIPSLFPFMALCTFVVRSGLIEDLGRHAERCMQTLFRLPGAAAGTVLLGLCGGYPVGMRMTAQLYETGAITSAQAERMSLFCVAAGPAFIVGTVGTGMLHSRTGGYLLFAALTLSSLTLGFLLRFTDVRQTPLVCNAPRQSIAQSLCDAVADAGSGMLTVSAWVLLFSGVCAVTARLNKAALPLGCLLEVTNGCRIAAQNALPLPLIAAMLGFGGLAVQCQLLPYARTCGVRLTRFWAFRALHGALAATYCTVLLRLFPQAQPVVLLQNGLTLEPVSASVPAAVALLVTAAVFILNTAADGPQVRSQP